MDVGSLSWVVTELVSELGRWLPRRSLMNLMLLNKEVYGGLVKSATFWMLVLDAFFGWSEVVQRCPKLTPFNLVQILKNAKCPKCNCKEYYFVFLKEDFYKLETDPQALQFSTTNPCIFCKSDEKTEFEIHGITFNKERKIICFTQDALIQNIVQDDMREITDRILDSYLYFYTIKVSTKELLNQLFAYINKYPTAVVRTLFYWINNHISTLLSEEEQEQFTTFINEISDQFPQLASSLENSLKQNLVSSNAYKKLECPKPIQPKSPTFLDFDPLEVARQLTLIEQELLLSIFPTHLLLQTTKKGQRTKSVLDHCSQFNKMNAGFISLILELPTINERASCIKHIVQIIQECLGLRNYGSAMSLSAALTSTTIHRLRHTWSKFISKHSKSNKLLEQQRSLFSPSGQFAKLREKCDYEDGPIVVFLGMYLTDLTLFEDGNPTYLTRGALNFMKIESMAGVIKKFMKTKRFRYNFSEVPVIKNFLLDMKILTDNEQYQKSLLLEPRGS